MGTLTSCSFTPADLKFLSVPHCRTSRGRFRFLKVTSLRNPCFLCRERSFMVTRKVLYRKLDRFRCFSVENDSNGDGDRSSEASRDSKTTATTTAEPDEVAEEFNAKKNTLPASVSSRPPILPPVGPAYNNFQIDSFKLMELLGPEKVDPADVKLIKEKLFGYSTFWVTKEEPFGDFGEGILFLGNLRGKREEVFPKLQSQLAEVTSQKYNLFMVEEPNSEGPDPRGGPRVSFGLLRKEVSEPGPTTLWQYVIALLLFLLTIGSSVELGIASQLNRLPPEIVKYFTDPNAAEPPDLKLLCPFAEAGLPLAYGVLGVLLFHDHKQSFCVIAALEVNLYQVETKLGSLYSFGR